MIDGAGTNNYTHDTCDRLTAASHPNQTNETYTLDDVGNRTASHQGSSYSYQAFNRLVTANSSSFGYNTNGNLTSKVDASGSWTYTWDYENRLKQASKSGGVTVTYSYDALGRRIQRTSSAGGTTKFVYDGADVVRDLDGMGATIADYLNGPGIDNKLRQTASGTVAYFATDHLGTTRALTDASGNLTINLAYDSFGNITSGSSPTRYTFTGREIDGDAGLMYYRARWYDPQQGRFISEDPIGLAGGINSFAYVSNNPQNETDPSGLCAESKPCDVQIPDERARAIVAAALGEGTPFNSGGQYPKPQRTTEPMLPLTEQEFRNEAFYMASVMINRFNTGEYASYDAVASDPSQFFGYRDGKNRINQLGNNGDEYCERARYIMDALAWIDQNGAFPEVRFWRGVYQPDMPGGRRAFRQGDIRAANTDFMVRNPESRAYRALPYWTDNGWRTPATRRRR